MQPRFVGRLGLADGVTVGNAMLGFVAAFVAVQDAGIAARIVLLAAVLDGLDGVIARKRGGSAAGPYLDSLADVASFGVAPALLIASRAAEAWTFGGEPLRYALALLLPAIYVGMAVTRLGLYTAYDSGSSETKGVPTTLAATILSAGVLAGFVGPGLLVALSGLLAALMVTQITYPDLHPQDAIVMGIVQVLAIVLRGRPGEVFAFALLFLALAYLTLGPRYYWTG